MRLARPRLSFSIRNLMVALAVSAGFLMMLGPSSPLWPTYSHDTWFKILSPVNVAMGAGTTYLTEADLEAHAARMTSPAVLLAFTSQTRTSRRSR